MNICHKSSLISDYFAVNWTLFPNFDKNIEYTLECISIGKRFYGLADVCEGKHGRSHAFTLMRISFLFITAFLLRWRVVYECSSLQVSLDCHGRLYLYV
jgi:hypothetical protein